MKKKITVSSIITILLLAAAVAAFFIFGRKKKVSDAVPPIRLVEAIIADSSDPTHRLVSGYDAKDASKAVFLLGSKSRCDKLAAAFMDCDSFDNVDGRAVPDALKDFAGESICTLSGFNDADALCANGKDLELRELTVRSVLAALDTLCYVSPYDRSGMGKKPLPKMLVLASPYMSCFGKYDVDSLFHALGCKVPVVSPLHLACGEAVASKAPHTKLTVGVLLDSLGADSHAYCSMIAQRAVAAGLDSALCIPFVAPAKGDALVSLLDAYTELGLNRTLDAIILDDGRTLYGDLQHSLQHITSVMNAESMTYGNLLSGDFRIIDARSLVCDRVYSMLREENLFTHKVSQPVQLNYMVIPKEGSESSLMLLQYNERYIPNQN